MLIAIDCWSRGITPTYVAGFRAFLDLNRCVRKGERAIRILAPVTVKERDEHGETTGEKKVFFRTVPVFDVSMTDPLPGKQPVPLSPPAEPITGDSHHHLIAPPDRSRRAARLHGRDPRAPRARARRLVRPQAPPDRRRQRTRQPAGPHAHPRTGPRTRSRLRAVRPRAGRGPGRLRDLLRARLASVSTSAASRSPTSPAGAKTAPSTRSANTRRRSTRSPGASKTRSTRRPSRPPKQSSPKCWRRSRAGAVGGCVPR